MHAHEGFPAHAGGIETHFAMTAMSSSTWMHTLPEGQLVGVHCPMFAAAAQLLAASGGGLVSFWSATSRDSSASALPLSCRTALSSRAPLSWRSPLSAVVSGDVATPPHATSRVAAATIERA
jgi:hypothetical protein